MRRRWQRTMGDLWGGWTDSFYEADGQDLKADMHGGTRGETASVPYR